MRKSKPQTQTAEGHKAITFRQLSARCYDFRKDAPEETCENLLNMSKECRPGACPVWRKLRYVAASTARRGNK